MIALDHHGFRAFGNDGAVPDCFHEMFLLLGLLGLLICARMALVFAGLRTCKEYIMHRIDQAPAVHKKRHRK